MCSLAFSFCLSAAAIDSPMGFALHILPGAACLRPSGCDCTLASGMEDEANAKGWTVISMKNDWKRIFAGAE
jgi:hypothetical protein